MSNKNAVIVSIKDYELLCSNSAKFLKDYNIFLVRGSGQNADLKGTYRELIVDNPDDGQMILTAFKEILKENEMKDNLLVFFGKNLPRMDKEALSEYKTVFCPKGNLKKGVDEFINKQSYQNSRNKSSADKAPKKQDVKENEKKSENKTESKAVTAPNTPNEFYNPFTGIGTEDKQAENVGKSIPKGKKVGEVPKTIPDDVAEENKKITGMITAEKARLVNLLRKRLSFHIKLCIKTELSPREVFLLVELVSKIPPKENWNKEKFGEWSWEAERKKLLESWKSVQGNESLTKLTFDDYVKIKKEIIYYYNLAAFLYGEDVYQGF